MASLDRQGVLEALYQRIAAAQGVLLAPVHDLAQDIGVPPARLYYLVRSFTQSGALWSRSRGPRGLEIRRGDAEAGTEAPARGARAGFCPWCGHPAESGWRFCMACGKRLPS